MNSANDVISADMELVREYVGSGSDAAFEAVVAKHVNLVYSAAFRQVRNEDLAKEITQAVFILLSKKAKSLGPETILPSWLYRATGFVAADVLRSQRRRQEYEHEASMQRAVNEETVEEAWGEMLPLLDDLMGRLRESDRDALVLRFFENKTLQEVGVALGLEERAAQKRVTRALGKLRTLFLKRGVKLTVGTIAGAVAAHSVEAAPTGLVSTAAAVAKGTAAPASTISFAQAGARSMKWARLKPILIACAFVPVAGISWAAFEITRGHGPEVAAFSSFGPGRGHIPNQSAAISGTNGQAMLHGYQGHAESFVATASGRLSSIEMPMCTFGESRVNIYIAADSFNYPGEILERFLDQLPPAVYSKEKVKQIIQVRHKMLPPMQYQFTAKTGYWIVKSSKHPKLKAGQKYWICAEPASEDAELIWDETNLQTTNWFAMSHSHGIWELRSPNEFKIYKGKNDPKARAFNCAYRVNIYAEAADVAVNK